MATQTNLQILGFTGDYIFLANSYPAPHIIGGITYPTAEHSFQAHKSMDRDVRWHIAQLDSPRDAMDQGYRIALRPDWEKVKTDVMRIVLMQKFTFQPGLGAKLVATGDAYLEDTNYQNETFWGVCNGVGDNHLGQALMHVRRAIRPLFVDYN